MVKACKSVVFSRIQSVLGIAPLDHNTGIPGYAVSLGSALIWAIREANLHHAAKPTMVFNIKLDGRPFAGTDVILTSSFQVCFLSISYFIALKFC